jgi:Fic family protein
MISKRKTNMKKYPWLTFNVNLQSLPPKSWIQLGECVSKCVHISRIPLQPGFAKEMHLIYLTKGIRGTTAIEGNTLTEKQVKQRVMKELQLPPSKEYLGKEVDNILVLCNEIKNSIDRGEKIQITLENICKYNKVILDNVPVPEYVKPGKLRSYPVDAGTYKAPDSASVKSLLKRLCDWLDSAQFDSETEALAYAIIKAIVAHIYIAWIHPFGDGNGRVARILEFAILLGSGVPSPAAHLFSNHYNATRAEYYRQLALASKKKTIVHFVAYAIQGFLDGLNEQLEYIFKQTLGIFWQSYVYEAFEKSRHNKTAKRRLQLILSLSNFKKPFSRKKVRKLISEIKNLSELYKGKTQKTVSRDIKELMNLGLIRKKLKGYEIAIDKLLAFLPIKSE